MPLAVSRIPRPLGPLILSLLWLAACVFIVPATRQQAAGRSPDESLAEGRRLAAAGEWDAAAAAYGDAMAGTGETGLTARFELARLDARRGANADAAALLGGLVAGPGPGQLIARGWFLLGSVDSDLGNHAAAAAAYAQYAGLGGSAAAYARVEQARELSTDDRDGALSALAPVLNGSGPLPARLRGLRLAGSIEEGAGHQQQALGWYTMLLGLASSDSDRIAALDRIGALNQALGNVDAAVDAWRALTAQYPASPEAEAALASLSDAGHAADPLAAGIVHYNRRNNQQARDLLNAYLQANGSTGPGAATALYYLGLLADRRDDTDLALEDYQEAYDADPTGRLAVEALWERAGTLDLAGRAADAQAAYALVAGRFPASNRAADAAFRAGYLAYTAGQPAQARASWSGALDGADDTAAARAAFWTGRAAADTGDVTGAQQSYADAVRRDPAGYYGLRAAALLAGQPGAPKAAAVPLTIPAADWSGAETWLASWAGPEDAAAWQSLGGSEDWQAAIDMLAIGWERTGAGAVQAIIAARAKQPWLLYRMARTLSDMGEVNLALGAAARLLGAAPGAAPASAAALARLAYPAPWPEQVTAAAIGEGVDPLLLYALIRQESAFNPEAGSSAGAYGLTQIVPGTAGDIARALAASPFDFADLARPSVAIPFGAYYLAAQLRAFDGSVYEALAAYNGGGGNAARWAKIAGNDVDRFYEAIDFSETKLYLRLVLQNYARYRALYGVSAAPALTNG